MANLKEIRIRISSVESTKQITSAMKLVAASKLKRATDSVTTMRPYAQKLGEILQDLSSGTDTEGNIYGEHDGLTVAEIELPSEDFAYEKPSWLGEEVTGDVRYFNSMLMKTPFTTW